MTSITETSLVIQREKLRQQLQQQRKLIAEQLFPESDGNNHYPRSMTMRFLTQRPALIGKVFTELMTLLVGVRLFKLLGSLLVLVRILQPSLINEPKRLSATKIQ